MYRYLPFYRNKGSVACDSVESRETAQGGTSAENGSDQGGKSSNPDIESDKSKGRVGDFVARTRASISNLFTKK